MIKKLLLCVVAILALALAVLHSIGEGWFGDFWQSAPVTPGPRPVAESSATAPLPVGSDPGAPATVPTKTSSHILFGDLHTHTNFSADAYLFNMQLVKGTGVVTPADACDFARYCSALDFWSINDHAEALTPRAWADSVAAVRQCNAQAGSPDNPDMVAFLGWEWSNSDRDDLPSHYGHKNVIFRTWEEGQSPLRPIASTPIYALTKPPSALFGLLAFSDGVEDAADFGKFVNEARDTPMCEPNTPVRDLPLDCREVAATPGALYRKLDEWGFDALVIPHGLAWGTTNPMGADFVTQMDVHEQRYQKLLETYSGHGNSERFEDFQHIGELSNGEKYCPPATTNFLPCCRRVAQIEAERCETEGQTLCEDRAQTAMFDYVNAGPRARSKLYPDLTLDDWAGCGQLQNSFLPASSYVPRMSTQYNLALGFDAAAQPKRARFGLIGSSDNHVARPGNSYKETNRILYTDSKAVSGEPTWSYADAKETGGFYYTGGLVAVHSQGRDRDSIWRALDTRQVYATSGDRMLVWFDLINGPHGVAPMGSEVTMGQMPRFRVRALGAFEQREGCPDFAVAALGDARVKQLCGGECYRAGERRKAITRIEIVRIRPQIDPGEDIAPLIDHQWLVFDCPADGNGCDTEFEDPEFDLEQRPAVYYARVIQEAEPLINGDPFGCEYDAEGVCIERRYCIDENAGPDDNCLGTAEPRAWTSPIFIDYAGAPVTSNREAAGANTVGF